MNIFKKTKVSGMILLGATMLVFTSISSHAQFFNLGTFWKKKSGDPCEGIAMGSAASGGAICAGTFKGNKYMITPGGCTLATPIVCDGTQDALIRKWGENVADIPDVENVTNASTPSTQLGDEATPKIAAHAIGGVNVAAYYCENMNYGGFTDWYLPSKSELVYVFCNSNRSGNRAMGPEERPDCGGDYNGPTTLLTGFDLDDYWSSTESSDTHAWSLHFGMGLQIATHKSFAATQNVRCIRRY